MDTFTKHYLIAALWSSNDDDGEPIDNEYSIDDCSTKMIEQAIDDCTRFQAINRKDLVSYPIEEAGHDFWLTRNHHGCGYWEADHCTKEAGKRLTDSAHTFNEISVVVGDDGKLYTE